MKKVVGKNVAIASGIICILLAVSLVGAIANYTSIINAKDNIITSKESAINNLNSQIASKNSQITENNNTISSLNSQIATLQSQVSSDKSTITNLQGQVASANSQISSLTSTVTTLQSQVNDLTAIINMSKSKLQTLAFHVCEKGEGYTWGHIPDVNYTCNQILALNNNTYSVLLLPEYKGHKNWTEELSWISANFGGVSGIPIMLDVFGGGPGETPTPQLSTDDILAAMAVANVQWLRFAEVVSWHIEQSLPFPTEYVTGILNFCRANGLKLFWTEWKVETFKAIQTYIVGYEDIVTVAFSTNSGDLEPADGFMLVSKMFQHWGGSVQAWYWTTRYDSDPLNMPISLLIQHALSAKNIGAEILQFEPYWYFFDNGQANENLKLLETILA
jgi:archaellum component FlaC